MINHDWITFIRERRLKIFIHFLQNNSNYWRANSSLLHVAAKELIWEDLKRNKQKTANYRFHDQDSPI